MYKTPVNERKRRSVINENSTMKTPVGALGTSVVEPSVLNTPEEPGKVCVFVRRDSKNEICNVSHFIMTLSKYVYLVIQLL